MPESYALGKLRRNSMLGSTKVITFVPSRDTKRAKAFYEGILGLRFVTEDQFAAVFDANGIMLRIVNIPESQPASFTILGWQVSDIEATVTSLQERGVQFQRYVGMDQDPLGIWNSPSGAKVAWFKDPDDNILSVTE
jgi:predicted enzyme related to lactoylglutathione lyase